MHAAEEHDIGNCASGNIKLLPEDEAVGHFDAGQLIEYAELSPGDFCHDVGDEEVDFIFVEEMDHELQE
jgi:hypothetical protein